MRPLRIIVALLAVFTVISTGHTVDASHRCPRVSWGSLPKESSQVATDSHLTGVRVGRHSCFDRLVIDLDGPATGYQVGYTEKLSGIGSGEELPVLGGAIIAVTVLAPAYDDAGQATVDGTAVDATNVAGFSTFRDVAWAGSFEGRTSLGLGTRARLPFRVFTLDGPGAGSRLVIDVAHRWSTTAGSPSPTLPGEPFDTHLKQGDVVGVMGVAHNDVLNIRAAPGTDQAIVTTAGATKEDVVATGRARKLPNSIWYEVTVGRTTGWANSSFLALIGNTDDVTSSFVGGGPLPAAETMVGLGELIAAGFASDDPPSRIAQSVAPSIGDLGSITYDVVGLGDDAVAGRRLHIFATPHDSGDGFVLKSIEATEFCHRGFDGTLCV